MKNEMGINENIIIAQIRKELKAASDKKVKEASQRFFKETIKCYGVKTPVAVKIGKAHLKACKGKTKAEIFDLCDQLWQSGYIEESFIACNWSYAMRKAYEPSDFKRFEKWINDYVNNWASCDTLCNHTLGEFLEMYPAQMAKLKLFVKSPNKWMRRAAAVSLIIPAKKGKFLDDILKIADGLLLDKEDLVQKGYGWMLKAASIVHQHQIAAYVIKNKAIMPRTALRYAIEKMPASLKAQAMEK